MALKASTISCMQQVLQALELAASVVQELSLLSSADPQKAEAQTSQFLDTAKVRRLRKLLS